MQNQVQVLDILLLPTVLEFLCFSDLRSYQYLSKRVLGIIRDVNNDGGYWHTLCKAFAKQFGLYHQCFWMNPIQARQHMIHDLFQSINKWAIVSDKVVQNFKVKTVCRFRPGAHSSGKVLLPLHQFLKLRREKLRDGDGEVENCDDPLRKFGKQIPEQYLDPIIGTLMRNPVQLGPSKRVVDRSVAVQCILHGSKDPFSNEKLQSSDLLPLPELQTEIENWAKENLDYDPSVNISDLQSLVNEGNEIDPRLLDALLDVQQLSVHSDSLYLATKHNNSAHLHNAHVYETTTFPTGGDPATEAPETDAVNDTHGAVMTFDFNNHEQSTRAGGSDALNSRPQERTLKLKSADVAKVVDVNPGNAFVAMHVPGKGITSFHYAKVFHEKSRNDTQAYVYDNAVKDSILATMNGYNACVLFYGQTGSGKTYTLGGDTSSLDHFAEYYESKSQHMSMGEILRHINASKNAVAQRSNHHHYHFEKTFPETSGITLRSLMELLYSKEMMKSQGVDVELHAQFIEIYNEKASDLLTGKSLVIRRNTGEPAGATTTPINTMGDAIYLLQQAKSRQRYAATEMNEHSSRSHTTLIVTVVQSTNDKNHSGVDDAEVNATEVKTCTSKLYLVDLAGSERLKKSKATGARLHEAVVINSSLLTVGKVISALAEGKVHIPYLESKLTTLLRNAFGGNCKTTVFINCRPDESHADETLQSMRFGERCGMVLNATKHAATSKESAMEAIDKAIDRVSRQLHALKAHGRGSGETFDQLQAAYNSLVHKRKSIEMIV